LGKFLVCVRKLRGTEGKVIDVLTGSMPRAVIRAGSALTALALIAVEALTLTTFSVTDTLPGAFGISMASVIA
jgi:hypothetical protein